VLAFNQARAFVSPHDCAKSNPADNGASFSARRKQGALCPNRASSGEKVSEQPKEDKVTSPRLLSPDISGELLATSAADHIPSLQSDAPITKSSEDQLNRTSLAKALARAINNIDARESFVVGIYGGWGTGKTSLLNLLQEQLEIESTLPPLIMRFNPWDFSSQEQLASQFFRELSVFLRVHETIPKLSRVANIVEQYGMLLSPVARVVIPQAAEVTKFGWSLFKKIGPRSIRTTVDLKAEINSVLTTLNRKLVILVDDIDRLDASEIRQTFQLVKLNANFANTVYVAAFKKEAVEKALSKVSPGHPGEYLEKIVQVAFPLPAISETKLTEFILNNFNKILEWFPVAEVNQQRFASMFHAGFRKYFHTLRNVTRYFNSFRFALAMIGSETNFTDLAAIQALALFEPDLYLTIEANSDVFVSAERAAFSSKDEIEKTLDRIFHSVRLKDEEAAKDLCEFLFPRFASRKLTFDSDREMQWEKDKRVCASRYFPFYFQLAVPEGEVSSAEMSRILEECASVDRFVAELDRINSSGRFAAFVDVLRHRLSDLDRTKLKIILSSIFVYGDKVSDKRSGILSISDHLRFSMWLLLDIIALLGDDRYHDLIEAMTGKPAVYTVVRVTTTFQEASERVKGGNDLRLQDRFPGLTDEVVERLKKTAVDVIESSAQNNKLYDTPGIPAILYRWRQWGGRENADAFVESAFLKDSRSAVSFVSRFLQRSESISAGDRISRVTSYIQLKSIAEFVDLHRLTKLVRGSGDSGLAPEELEAKRLFLLKMDRLDSGESIDSIDNPMNLG
jgi:predicted KAP-like P-loop ATPase